ncbi:MAG TPA: hypothetical protein VKV36_04285 [Acidimicrobiales bacterium]|nr:hypothetical protein [Acidimicrobiales bacterium]HLH46595.1 hypothetical protein [Acidimicrobiales bacterium]
MPTAVRAAAALAAAAALSGCLGTGYVYISHRSPDGTDVYFKVPSRWTVYDAKAIFEAQNGPLGPSELKQLTDGQWIEALSAAPRPTVSSALTIGSRFPTGVVDAHQLGPTDRDQLSFSSMRAAILGTDPLTASSGFQVLSYQEFTGPGGVRGVKMVVNIDGKGPVKTFGQVVAVDAQTNWIFAIGVGCEVSCWGANAGSIRQVLGSWTLKESRT